MSKSIIVFCIGHSTTDLKSTIELEKHLTENEYKKGDKALICISNRKRTRGARMYLGYDGEDWNFLEASTPLGGRYYDYLVYLFNKNKSHE